MIKLLSMGKREYQLAVLKKFIVLLQKNVICIFNEDPNFIKKVEV